MATQYASESAGAAPAKAAGEEVASEYPVREYIGAMALELAQMARWDGDEALARILESAATLAVEAVTRKPVEVAQPDRPRPA